MSAVSTRRKLFGGVAAVVGGSTLTSGMAAGIAAAVEPSSAEPDADLVRLCREFVVLELATREIFDGPNRERNEDKARAAVDPLEARMDALLDEMEPLRAVSAVGVLARADALAAHNGDFGGSFDSPEVAAGRLLTCLLRDAAALVGRA